MARRNILLLDLVELFTHWHAGRSQVALSASLGIDRKTVRKYLAPAIADGVEPGGEPLSAEQWAELIGGWFPELGDRSGAGLDVAAVRAAPGSDQGLAGR